MKMIAVLTLVSLAGVGSLVEQAAQASPNDGASGAGRGADTVIERFLGSASPELTSYAARRRLTASTRGGRMRAQLDAWTYLEPDGRFRFEVVCADGSSMIRKRVLVAALEAEQESRSRGEMAQAALTRDNYDFIAVTTPGTDLEPLRLLPRRKSRMLVDGSIYVRRGTADLVLVEGRLSRTPSWWTRRVDIVRRYARVAGVRVPIEMTSTADVRVVGASTFSMTYDYHAINGVTVADAPSAGCELPAAGSLTMAGTESR